MTTLIGSASPGTPTRVVRGRRARRDAAVRVGAMSALWLSLLLVTYWWVTGGGVQDLGGWDIGLLSTGRLSGLVASVLLLAQVLLMARCRSSSTHSVRTGSPTCTDWSASRRST